MYVPAVAITEVVSVPPVLGSTFPPTCASYQMMVVPGGGFPEIVPFNVAACPVQIVTLGAFTTIFVKATTPLVPAPPCVAPLGGN